MAHLEIPKISFKIQERSQVALFANTAEAVVFWLSIVGLLLVLGLAAFRFFATKSISGDYRNLQTRQTVLQSTVDSLRLENQEFHQQLEQLRLDLQHIQAENDSSRRAALDTPVTPGLADARVPRRTVPQTDGRSAFVKQFFGIQRSDELPATAAK